MICTRIVVDTSILVPCSVKLCQTGPCQHHPGTSTPTVPGTRHASADWRQEEAEHRRPGRLCGRPPHRLQRRGQLTACAGGRHQLPFLPWSRTTQSTSTARLCSSREQFLSVFSPGYPCSSPPRLLLPPGGHPGQVTHHRHGAQPGH